MRGSISGVSRKLMHKLIKTDVAIVVHVQLVEQFLQLLNTVTKFTVRKCVGKEVYANIYVPYTTIL